MPVLPPIIKIILIIVAFIVLMALVFELFYGFKIGRGVCNLIGKGFVSSFGFLSSIIVGAGYQALCNAIPF